MKKTASRQRLIVSRSSVDCELVRQESPASVRQSDEKLVAEEVTEEDAKPAPPVHHAVRLLDVYSMEPKPRTMSGGLITVFVWAATAAYIAFVVAEFSKTPATTIASILWSQVAGPYPAEFVCTTMTGCWVSNHYSPFWLAATVQPVASQSACVLIPYGGTSAVTTHYDIAFSVNPFDGMSVIFDAHQTDRSQPHGLGFALRSQGQCPPAGNSACISGCYYINGPGGGGLSLLSYVHTDNSTASLPGGAPTRNEWFVTRTNTDSAIDWDSTTCTSDMLEGNASAKFVQGRLRMQPSYTVISVQKGGWLSLWGIAGGAYAVFVQAGAITLLLFTTAVMIHGWWVKPSTNKVLGQQPAAADVTVSISETASAPPTPPAPPTLRGTPLFLRRKPEPQPSSDGSTASDAAMLGGLVERRLSSPGRGESAPGMSPRGSTSPVRRAESSGMSPRGTPTRWHASTSASPPEAGGGDADARTRYFRQASNVGGAGVSSSVGRADLLRAAVPNTWHSTSFTRSGSTAVPEMVQITMPPNAQLSSRLDGGTLASGRRQGGSYNGGLTISSEPSPPPLASARKFETFSNAGGGSSGGGSGGSGGGVPLSSSFEQQKFASFGGDRGSRDGGGGDGGGAGPSPRQSGYPMMPRLNLGGRTKSLAEHGPLHLSTPSAGRPPQRPPQ